MKRMRFIIIFISFLVSLNAFGEDIIVFGTGNIIKAVVLEVGIDEIKYKKASNPDGPVYTIAKSDVFSITYGNGDTDFFKSDNKSSNRVTDGPQFIEMHGDMENALIRSATNIEVSLNCKVKNKPAKKGVPVMWYGENSLLSTKDISMRILGAICNSKYNNFVMRYYIELKNKSQSNIYIDKTNCFRISNENVATSFFDNRVINISHNAGSGIGLGLGGVTNALGIGGAIGSLANGISIGGGKSHGSSISYSDERFLVIPPGGRVFLTEHKYEHVNGNTWQQISEAESYMFDVSLVKLKEGEIKEYDETISPYKNSYVITYSVSPNFENYSTLKADLYAKYLIGKSVRAPLMKLILDYPESFQNLKDVYKAYSSVIPDFEQLFGRIIIGRDYSIDE